MFIIGLGITTINDLAWLKYILASLNLVLYFLVAGAAAYKDGQDAMKVRYSNDVERREMVKTGEDRPLKLREEYKAYKGVLIALAACSPMIVLLFLQAIFNLTGVENMICGQIASYMYYVVFIFFRIAEITITKWVFFLSLIYAAILVLVYFIMYNLGARKIEHAQEKIRVARETVYGDKK